MIAAEDPDAVRRAWARLGEEVAVVVLTAKRIDGARRRAGPARRVLTVVMPP